MPLEELKTALLEINDLSSAAALLHWDQATYMPPGGAAARGRQSATLSRLAHEKLIAPRIGELLDELRPLETELPFDSDDASLIRVTRRQWERAARIPAEFEARFSAHTAQTYEVWTRARPANDFQSVRPLLEKTLDLSREMAGFFPHQHPADPLIAFSDEGFTVAQIRPLFAQLREQLVPLVEQVTARGPVSDAPLRGHFPEATQSLFAREVLTRIGYDWNRGRLDKTHHPFMTKFSLGDVRITNRSSEGDITQLLFGSLHEAGHALYEQGINPDFEGTPLAEGTSSGVHESQSRLWENLVGRSREFWSFWYPQLVAAFPSQLEEISLDDFLAANDRVERSAIRTEADELTYNLHVMIRFELECQMLEGSLAIADLPAAWREAYQHDLGVIVADEANGCLQDVHWFGGAIGGAFQGYTLGNILSAQFFEAALEAEPEIPAQIARGEFGPLLGWLTENIYRHGAKFSALELLERVTGKGLTIEPYVKYLTGKYGMDG